MRRELVKAWMSRDVVTVRPETTLAEAYNLMSDHRIRRLPVVDCGRLVGIITLGDLRGAEPGDAASLDSETLIFLLEQMQVHEIMSDDPVAIPADATIDEAAWMMLEGKFSGLPVVNESWELVGVITESDIFRLVVRTWGKPERDYIEWIKQRKEVARV